MLKLAILPSVVLFFMVWRADKIEKEPPALLLRLFIFGGLTVISAIVLGRMGERIVNLFLEPESMAYIIVDNFILTALIEEGGKYFVMKKTTWKHPAFNYTFDAVVYAVMASLGFATVENILYVLGDDISVAISRAVLAVPGHVIDAIFMGYYYGLAKLAQTSGDSRGMSSNLFKALLVPVLLHGFYDFCLSTGYDIFILFFFIFEIVVTVVAIKRVRRLSGEDREINADRVQ